MENKNDLDQKNVWKKKLKLFGPPRCRKKCFTSVSDKFEWLTSDKIYFRLCQCILIFELQKKWNQAKNALLPWYFVWLQINEWALFLRIGILIDKIDKIRFVL